MRDAGSGHRGSVTRRDISAGETLRAQATARACTALVLTALQTVMLRNPVTGAPSQAMIAYVAATGVGYLLALGAVQLLLRRRELASPAQVSAMLGIDLLFIFVLTAESTSSAHYDRALLGTFVIVHAANFYFGRRQAWRAVGVGVAGYILLIASAMVRGLHVDVAEEAWSLALCAACTSLMVLQASDVRRRLRTIVNLLEHAEEGDFAHTYDVAADAHPDAITRVGRAYNGVREQLANMVLTDPLTGCLNRRGFDQALAREVARTSRSRGTFALLAIDLDHFKEVNDTYGHMAGDVVLRNVGALLLAAGRAQDVVARVGGEEFGILLADATLDGAHLFASRLCDMIREHPFLIAGDATPVTVTTSIGVVAGSPRGEDTIATLLWSRADAALYAAKREGRDRACVWTSGLSGTDDYVIPSPHVQRDAIRRCSQELAAFQPTSAEASAP